MHKIRKNIGKNKLTFANAYKLENLKLFNSICIHLHWSFQVWFGFSQPQQAGHSAAYKYILCEHCVFKQFAHIVKQNANQTENGL